ncbi:MAG TPA: lysylphosphatidylglycerol synthase transmembrane domain-containing protein [Acidimicrobiales bacterium]
MSADESHGRVRRNVRRIVALLVLAAVVEFLVLPQLGGARRAWELAGDVQPLLLAAGLALQLGAYLSHAQLTRAMLPESHRPGLFAMARIEVASRAVSHVVPGGTAAGTALGYRLLRQRGVPGSMAGFAAGAQGIGAAVVLNVLLWVALVVSVPLRGVNPYYGATAAVGAVLIGGFSLMVLLLLAAEQRTGKVVGAVIGRIPLVDRDAVERVVHSIAERLRELRDDPPLLRRAIGWAAIHWILDAASLWVFLRAFGSAPAADALFVAFGIANVLAAIPVTPRGLGVVEAALITTLVAFGMPRGPTVLGVVSYRLVNFWVPIPVGALAYLSIRLSAPGEEAGPREVLARWIGEAAERAESVRDWAARYGLVRPRRPPSPRR